LRFSLLPSQSIDVTVCFELSPLQLHGPLSFPLQVLYQRIPLSP
jgi:hypothetical protein